MTVDSTTLSDNIDAPLWMFWKRRRYVVVIMAFFGFFNVYSLRVNLSIAIVAMTELKNITLENGTIIQEREFDWDSKTQGLVLSSFFYGYICTQFLGGYVATKLGGNYILGIGVGMTALLTLFTPMMTRINVFCLIGIRICQGFFSGVAFPSIYDVFAKWAPPQERSRITTITFTGNYAGTVITMPLGGLLAQFFGWDSIFYFFGALGMLWSIFWLIFISKSPETDQYITEEEKQYMVKCFSQKGNQKPPKKLPWLQICTSSALWAIIASQFAELWGFYMMLTQLPMFLKDTMNFDIKQLGIVSAFPYLAMAIMLSLGGYWSDSLQNSGVLTTTQVRKYFNCGAYVLKAIFMVIGAYFLTPAITITCIIIAVGLGGFAWCGFSVNLLDIAPQFAGVLMGITNTFGTMAGIVSPQVTGLIVQNQAGSEWQIVFYIASVIYIIGAVIYWIWASGEVQPWAITSEKTEEEELDDVEMTKLFKETYSGVRYSV